MKTPVLLSAFMGLPGSFLTPLAVAYASPLPPDTVHFCHPVDPDQLNRHHYPPAAKPLQDLNVGEPRTVRIFYFLPNDRPYRADVVEEMKTGIVELQAFFGEQMETHGHGRKTFNFETDDRGDPVVHRVDGDSSDSHYSGRGYTEGEINRAFDNSANIILIVMDVSSSSAHGRGTGGKGSGWAMVYGDWNWFAAAHELGHSFGLHHDFRDNEYIMSYGRADRASAKLSACAAGFLTAHPYFNSDVPLQNESHPTVELVSSSDFPFGSESMSPRLRVRDDDGLHQVILFVMPKNPFLGGTPEVKTCHGLSAQTDTVVEFNFDGRLPSDNVGTSPEAHTTLANTVQHRIHVIAVDTDGNRNNIPNSSYQFSLEAGHSPQHIATVDRPYYYDIGGLAISRDGSHLAIGTGGIVELMEAAERERITTFRHTEGNRYTNWSVAFSHDGRLLASGSANGTIKVWNVNTRVEAASLDGHTEQVLALDFSPDGTLLASGSWDSTVKLWDVTTWTNTDSLEGHTDGIVSLDFLPGGKLATKSWRDGTVRLWDVQTRSQNSTINTDAAGTVAFSPDGTALASSISWAIKLWSLSTGAQTGALNHMREYNYAQLAFSPDGTLLAVAANGLIEIWSVPTSELLATISGGPGGVGRMLFSPNGQQLIATADKGIKFWDVSEWTAPTTPVSQRTSQVREAILGVVRLDYPNVSSYAEITETHLAGITALYLNERGITSLKPGDFDGLSGLEELRLWGNQLTSLPEDIFSGLSSLAILRFGLNQLTTLPADLLDGLSSLTDLRMIGNQLTTLPDGIFEGLTGLARLALQSNSVDPLVLTVSLKKTGEGQFMAAAPTGAPFDIVLPLHVATGSINGGATTITIPAGAVESDALTVTRVPGTTFPVSVDIGTLPGLPSNHFGYELVKSSDIPLEVIDPLPGDIAPVCDRTLQVRNEIVRVIPGVSGCRNVTEAHLAGIRGRFTMSYPSTTELKAGDFSGLTAVTRLSIENTPLDELPVGVFTGLSGLKTLSLNGNQLTSLPEGVFSGLTALTHLYLDNGLYTTLADGVFDGLSSLTFLRMSHNQLTTLSAGVFSELTALDTLSLHNNKFSTLPGKVFSGLTALRYLDLEYNDFRTLPGGLFSGLTSLADLDLSFNELTALPAGLFSGLTALRKLSLWKGNAVNLVPLSVTLKKVKEGQFKAVAHSGAPFDMVLAITVVNGSIGPGATTITIPKGSVESQPLNVTRTSGTTAAVTVDIGTLPGLPSNHYGYELVKSPDLPREIIGDATAQASTDFNGDGKTDFVDFFLFADAYGSTDSRFDLDGNGTVDFVDFFQFVDAFDQPGQAKLLALAREMLGLPAETQLQQNAPNPFNSETVISWFLFEPGPVRVEVFSLTGQRVAVLHRGPLQAGFHRIHFDGRDDAGRALASGVYLYRLVSSDGVLTRKLTLLR